MFKLKYTPEAKSQLRKISKLLDQKTMADALIDIQTDPNLGKALKAELSGKFTYRVGNYRIIYSVNWKDQIVTLHTAKHRATVYN